jgi:hypothetical protein
MGGRLNSKTVGAMIGIGSVRFFFLLFHQFNPNHRSPSARLLSSFVVRKRKRCLVSLLLMLLSDACRHGLLLNDGNLALIGEENALRTSPTVNAGQTPVPSPSRIDHGRRTWKYKIHVMQASKSRATASGASTGMLTYRTLEFYS